MEKRKTKCCFSLICRKSKQKKNGFAPIELSIYNNGKRCYISLPRYEKPEVFKNSLRNKRFNELKKYCDDIFAKAQEVLSHMVLSNETINVFSIKNRLEEVLTHSSYYTTIDLFNDFMSTLNHRSITNRTYMKYVHLQDRFLSYYDGTKSPENITRRVVEDFKGILLTEFKSTTVSGYLCKLKSVIKFGVEKDEITSDPFRGVKIPKNTCPIETFTEEEFIRIHQANFRIERVRRVQEIFLFACGSGLSYIDVIALEPFDFRKQGDTYYIEKKRKKTGVTFYSVLLPCAVEVAVKYNFDLSQLKISNQKINQTLDDIQIHCEVTSIPSLTFHKARHYYITALIRKGVPIAIVQKCAGHSRIEQTLHYVHLCTKDIIEGVIEHL